MQDEISTLKAKKHELASALNTAEQTVHQLRESLHRCENELTTRRQEYDAMVSVVEEHEKALSLFDERERQITALAAESRARISEATVERERYLMQEKNLLKRIAALESQLDQDVTERQERHT